MRAFIGSFVFCLGVAAGSARSAAAADVPVAVLGIEPSEGATDELAAVITDALRQRVTAAKGFRLVAGRDLVEIKLIFSCPDEAPSCMAQAGKSLGAAKVIFGGVKKSTGDSHVVTLKLLDTNRGVVDAWVAEQIDRSQVSGPAIRGPVEKWFSSLTGQGGVGILRVRADVLGATVTLDGNPAGVLGNDDLVIPGVTAGKHEVVITKPGYSPERREATVAPGETVQVAVSLTPSAAARDGSDVPPVLSQREEPRSVDVEDDGRRGLRSATWGVLGAGVVGMALGIYFGLEVQSINNELDGLRRFMCSSPTKWCDENGNAASPRTPAENRFVSERRDDGNRFQTLQYISYGLGAALLATGGYLYYRAYVQEDDPMAARRSTPRWVVTPLVAPHLAGLVSQLRF